MSVVPRLLSDSLVELLRDLDLDDVVVDGPELPPGHYDAAIVSSPHGFIDTSVVIEVETDGGPEPRSGSGAIAPIPLKSPFDVLNVLDNFCGAGTSRVARLASLLPQPDGDH